MKTVAQAEKDSVALLLASFEPSAAAALDPAEKTTPRTVKGRRIETWSTSPMSVRLKTTLDGGKLAYGTTLGGTRAIDWFWGRPSPRPVAGAPPLIAVARADLPRIFKQLFGADPYAARTFDEIGKHLGLVTGALELDGATLGASLRMEIH